MASVKLAGILSGIFLLLFLSHAAAGLHQPTDESSAVAVVVPSDAQDDANSKIVQVSFAEVDEGSEKETTPESVKGSERADLISLRLPFHGRHHCRHSHRRGRRFHDGKVAIPYGNDMLPMPKDGGLAGGVRKDVEIAGAEVALPEEEERRWRRKRKERKRKKAEEDSDSHSDDEDEGAMEMARKKHRRWRKRKERKEKGGWLKWFMGLWD